MDVDINHDEGMAKIKETIQKTHDLEELRRLALSLISYIDKSHFEQEGENIGTAKDSNIQEGIALSDVKP